MLVPHGDGTEGKDTPSRPLDHGGMYRGSGGAGWRLRGIVFEKKKEEVSMMIRNVVFDFGQVMVRFEPKYMVEQYVSDPEDSILLQEVVFDRLYWDRLDEGTIADEEVVCACRERLPQRLHEAAEKIYYNWIYHIPEIEGMRALVRDIKRDFGVRTFLLSNISTYFAAHREEIPSLAEFEKCIFSAVCGHVKPHADMFAYLCEECEILPEETVFVDDSPKNIAGSEAFGIRGYLFDGDAEKLRAYLYEALKEQ